MSSVLLQETRSDQSRADPGKKLHVRLKSGLIRAADFGGAHLRSDSFTMGFFQQQDVQRFSDNDKLYLYLQLPSGPTSGDKRWRCFSVLLL